MNFSEKGSYRCFLLLFYLLIFQFVLAKYISQFGYLDELISLAAFPLFIQELRNNHMKIKIKRYGFLGLLILFSIVGLWGNFLFSYQPITTVALPAVYTNIKFWLCFYIGRSFLKNLNVEKYARNIYRHVFFVVLLFTVLIVLDNIFHIYSSETRYGLRATQLFYGIPTVFAAYSVFLFAILLVIRPYIAGSFMVCIWALVLLCSTLRSKAFAAAFAFCLIYYFAYIRKKRIRFRTILLFAPVALLIVWDQVEYYFFSSIQSDSARYQLLMVSLKIAGDYFPIGTGFGTFGSNLSTIFYSPLYSMYGIANVNGLRNGEAYFASDSFWPMILGETGIVGLIVFAIIVFRLFKRIQNLKKKNIACYTASMCVLAYLLIMSMAESAFVNPVSIPLAIWLGFMEKEAEKKAVKSLEESRTDR